MPDPEWVHMCVSQPALAAQIIADWKAKGAPRFLNVCENDGWAGCACPTCLSWDEPDPDNPVPFDQRLDAARRAFDGQEGRRGRMDVEAGIVIGPVRAVLEERFRGGAPDQAGRGSGQLRI